MKITIHDGKDVHELELEEGTVLEAVRQAGIVVNAPCGGNGTCGKCRMLMSDADGVGYKLACQEQVSDGLEVVVERSRDMAVSTGGTATVWQPDCNEDGLGVAIDVGTTTVAVRLYDLASGQNIRSIGRANPQIGYGADVISRITACEEGHLDEQFHLIDDALADMIGELTDLPGLEERPILRTVLDGNTTMQHIACNLDPVPIGKSPFTPRTLFGDVVPTDELGRLGKVGGEVIFTPCIAGYVGGDISCGMLAVDMYNQDAPTILLDLGTNGEMALGDKDAMVSCATAAGPVFEGAGIRHGMPAYPGAISKVFAKNGEFKVKTVGDMEAIGICGTGLMDTIALMLDYGLVDETGRMLDEDEIDTDESCGLEKYLTEEDGVLAYRIAPKVTVTQKDVRSVQLAKAAISAGIKVMLDERGIKMEDVGKVAIAGGFGEYLNLDSAARVGLFPMALRPKAKSVGNTALEGAGAALMSQAARDELARIAKDCNYVELSGHKGFNTYYVDEMLFEE